MQATDKLPPAPANQLEALLALNKQKSRSCLKVYDYKRKTQGDSGLVPNGYVLYLVVQEYPGVSLSTNFFWGLPLPERNEIREAFKVAYQYVS